MAHGNALYGQVVRTTHFGRHKRPSKITIPPAAHPLAKAVFAEAARQNVTYAELEFRSGVLIGTMKAWRVSNLPGLDTISAALGALGWDVLPVPKASTLPDGLREDLEAVAAKHCTALPVLEFISASVGYRHPTSCTVDARERRTKAARASKKSDTGHSRPANLDQRAAA